MHRLPCQHLQDRKRQQRICGMQQLPVILFVADWQLYIYLVRLQFWLLRYEWRHVYFMHSRHSFISSSISLWCL